MSKSQLEKTFGEDYRERIWKDKRHVHEDGRTKLFYVEIFGGLA